MRGMTTAMATNTFQNKALDFPISYCRRTLVKALSNSKCGAS